MNSKASSGLVALAIACALLTVGMEASTNASAAVAYEEDIVTQPGDSPTSAMQRAISHGASRAMLHIALARSAVHHDDARTAKDEIEEAERILDSIDAELPSTIARQHIRTAEEHLDYETTEKMIDDLLAIRASFVELLDYLPLTSVNRYRSQVDAIQDHLIKGEKKAARTGLRLLEADLVYAEVDVPVRTIRRYAATAKGDIARRDFAAADRALATAEDSVTVLTVAATEPLPRASRALHRAERHYTAGAFASAEHELGKGMTALEHAAKSESARAASVARQLLDEAKALAARIGQASESTGRELAQLDAKARAAVSEWTFLRQHRSHGTSAAAQAEYEMKAALVHARTHLSWAGADAFSSWPPEDMTRLRALAIANLDKTRGFLQDALERAPAGGITQAQIQALIDETAELESNLAVTDAADMYRKLDAQVRDMIQRV